MICPECESEKIFHPLAHVRASEDFGKFEGFYIFTPCPRCDGSGEDASQTDTLDGDQASAIEDQSMVA